MKKVDERAAGKRQKESKVEVRPDAWERFEHAVRAMTKSGPQHRASAKPTPRPTQKGRIL